jgi:hypothetical protein
LSPENFRLSSINYSEDVGFHLSHVGAFPTASLAIYSAFGAKGKGHERKEGRPASPRVSGSCIPDVAEGTVYALCDFRNEDATMA